MLHAWGKVRSAATGSRTGGSPAGAKLNPTERTVLKQRYLSAIDVFRDLPEAELERLAKTTTMVTCARGRRIYRAGDANDTLFLLKQGRVQIVRDTAEGKRLVTAVLGPETFFGEMALVGQHFPQDAAAEALDEAVICVMSRHDVERLILTHPRVGLRFLEQIGARLAETQAMVEEFAFKPVSSRLAGVLLRLARDEPNAEIEVTHQDLADMVATYRETITLSLGDFRDRGLVELGRRSIIILNRPGLEAEAEVDA